MNNTRQFPSPLRYPGGKYRIYPFIKSFIYENGIKGINYAEPYAGGGGLALQLLYDDCIENLYMNDLDLSIYSFWNAVLTHGEELCEWVSGVDVSIRSWLLYRSVLMNLTSVPRIELAKATLFLNRVNVSGVLKGGPIGGRAQRGKYKLDARFNRDVIVDRICKIMRYADRIKVSCREGKDFAQALEKRKENFLIYFDPPYFRKGKGLYMNYFKEEDHIKLAEFIVSLKKMWILSYDNEDFIKKLYRDNDKVVYQLAQCTSNKIGEEVLIFDKNSKYKTSIGHLVNPILLAKQRCPYGSTKSILQ